MAMRAAVVERWVWTLVYAGLLTFVIGLAVGDRDPATSWLLLIGGLVVAAVGALLIYVRSRMKP